MLPNIAVVAALLLAADARIESQHLQVSLDPAAHTARVTASLETMGKGELQLRLHPAATNIEYEAQAGIVTVTLNDAPGDGEPHVLRITKTNPAVTHVAVTYDAVFEQDVEAGEVAGQIHNKSVSAHVGENGIFLSDGSAWHPQWVGEDGRPRLVHMSVEIEPMDGWAMVASGEPEAPARSLADPVWRWFTPRPVDGLAIVGNRHVLVGAMHETSNGSVEIVMHVPSEHEDLAPMFIEAAKSYLDLYVPLLGAFPYRRFSIVENFFSSGFAYPGFTVLGPQVVGMAPRSLAPGYLDHELIHNWWGNGVYVSADDGNWCEALTTYCANYYRRIADEGEEAGRAYRRGLLMKLSTDPAAFDNGPLDTFGRDQTLDRFVGYDKGAFVFSMIEGGAPYAPVTDGRAAMFRALSRFAQDHMGRFATWDDLRKAFEAEFDVPLEAYFRRWVRRHTVPETTMVDYEDGIDHFSRQFGVQLDEAHFRTGEEDGRRWIEVDPEFRLYRVLPPEHLVPTIAGTEGPGGMRVVTEETRSEVRSYLPRLDATDDGENLLLIGAAAVAQHADLIARTGNPITVGDGRFTIDGVTYDQPGQAVLHTMHNPDSVGRYITVFHSNGEAGWERLRLIGFYTRDTTIIWADGRTIGRSVFEPDRRFWLED